MTQPVILIADDEAEAADLLGLLLGLHLPQAAVRVAHGGQAGLDLAIRERPDAAVLDLEMPGLDGEALAFALRAAYPDAAPLLIALSGNVVRLAQIQGNGAFDHHFGKPADVDGLVGLLKVLC
ncbi:response regulator [Variovorax paradoxus]|uniref:response regulator n=1 Tax=Variovorax paradoxus TaxID=34073 RepID=UPI00339A4A68